MKCAKKECNNEIESNNHKNCYCRIHHNEYHNKYYKEHKEKIMGYSKEYRKNYYIEHKAKIDETTRQYIKNNTTTDLITGKTIRKGSHYCKMAKYKRDFKLTKRDIKNLKKKQNALCPICKKGLETFLPHYIAIDHCHKSNKVRGILCRQCNLLLGHANDDIQILKKAISYLNKHNKIHV